VLAAMRSAFGRHALATDDWSSRSAIGGARLIG